MDLEQIIAKMTDAEKQAILNEELPPEIEKEAAAEVAEAELHNALYAYGALTADIEVETEEADEAGLSKEASEQFESASAEIEAAIEQGVQELELDQIEDSVEMHKVAMASAALIFEGYCDQLEKLAKGGKGLMPRIKGIAKTIGKHVSKGAEKAKEMAAAGGKMAKKHKKSALIGAASAAAGYGAGRMHKKEASANMTDAEFTDVIVEAVLEKQATADVIVDGVEKLAARGASMGAKLSKGMGAVKKHLKGHGKHMAGAGAAGALGGYMARKLQKRD